jgi:hypothetical protein
MKIKKYKKSEKGFAIALALILLVAMSLLGTSLVFVVGNDHRENAYVDTDQQSFYAAETGIAEARKWLATGPGLSLAKPNLEFCNAESFSILKSSALKAIGAGHVGTNTLDNIITPTGSEKKLVDKEKDRLKQFRYEYFVTYTPDKNGDTDPNLAQTIDGKKLVPRQKDVAGSTGTSVAEGTSYKSGGTSTGTYYTIFSCGCKGTAAKCKKGENKVIKLIAEVLLVQ